jgi:hypothetical protein
MVSPDAAGTHSPPISMARAAKGMAARSALLLTEFIGFILSHSSARLSRRGLPPCITLDQPDNGRIVELAMACRAEHSVEGRRKAAQRQSGAGLQRRLLRQP